MSKPPVPKSPGAYRYFEIVNLAGEGRRLITKARNFDTHAPTMEELAALGDVIDLNEVAKSFSSLRFRQPRVKLRTLFEF